MGQEQNGTEISGMDEARPREGIVGSSRGPKHDDSSACHSRLDSTFCATDCLVAYSEDSAARLPRAKGQPWGKEENCLWPSGAHLAQGPPPPERPSSTGSLMAPKQGSAISDSTSLDDNCFTAPQATAIKASSAVALCSCFQSVGRKVALLANRIGDDPKTQEGRDHTQGAGGWVKLRV